MCATRRPTRSSTSTLAPPRRGGNWGGPRCLTWRGACGGRSTGTRSSSPMGSKPADALRAEILELVRQYHEAAFPPRDFVAGTSSVPCASRVFDAEELTLLVDSSLDFWLTTGR